MMYLEVITTRRAVLFDISRRRDKTCPCDLCHSSWASCVHSSTLKLT